MLEALQHRYCSTESLHGYLFVVFKRYLIVLQSGGECLRAFVSIGLDQISQWHDAQGELIMNENVSVLCLGDCYSYVPPQTSVYMVSVHQCITETVLLSHSFLRTIVY